MKSKVSDNLTTNIATESENLAESLKTLLNMLDVATNYVNDVVVCDLVFFNNLIFGINIVANLGGKERR